MSSLVLHILHRTKYDILTMSIVILRIYGMHFTHTKKIVQGINVVIIGFRGFFN